MPYTYGGFYFTIGRLISFNTNYGSCRMFFWILVVNEMLFSFLIRYFFNDFNT